jgi:ADP-heptose:LPS heptosyltransferase
MASSDRVVVQLKSFIGDAVMAMPLLESLRAQTETFVAAPALIGEVLGPDWADHFIPIRGSGFRSRLVAVRAAKADISIVLNRSFRSALVARAAGIKRRVGHNVEGRGFMLTDRVDFDPSRHETESYLDLARAYGFATPVTQPHLTVTPAEVARGKELIGVATVALQPGARHGYKRLPIPVLVETAKAILGAGHQIALIGGRDETDTSQAFLEESGIDCLDLVGKTSLRETCGILASSRLAVGSDTGIMHIAAAVGCPTVTVFEPSQPPTRWGHLYAPHRIVETPVAGIEALDPAALASTVLAALAALEPAGSPKR